MRRAQSTARLGAFLLFGLGACSSETKGTAAIGASCQASAECGSGLRCAKEGDEPSACTKDCASDSECGTGFTCQATDIGPDHATPKICVKSCTTASRDECAPWVCNTSRNACEPK